MRALSFVLAGILSLPAGAGSYIRTDDDLTRFSKENDLIDTVMEMMIRRTTRAEDDVFLFRRYYLDEGGLSHENISLAQPLDIQYEGEKRHQRLSHSAKQEKTGSSGFYKGDSGSTDLKLFYWHLSDDDSDSIKAINEQFDVLTENFSQLQEIRQANPDLFVFSGVSNVEYMSQIRSLCLSVLGLSMSSEAAEEACDLSESGTDYLNAQTEHLLFGSNFLAISPLPLEPFINRFDDVGLTLWRKMGWFSRVSSANMAYMAQYRILKDGHWHSIVQLTGDHSYAWSYPKQGQEDDWEWIMINRVKLVLDDMLAEGESAHVLTHIAEDIYPKEEIATLLKSAPKVYQDNQPDFDPENNGLAEQIIYKYNYLHRPKSQQMAQVYLYRKGKKIKKSGASIKRLVLKRPQKDGADNAGWFDWLWSGQPHRDLSPYYPSVTTLKYRHVEINAAVVEPESSSREVPDVVPELPMIDGLLNRY
ncbi:hypothetical protein [Endozoicomonas arenosclerae]|uniref:hypothetical protein n=1 Tax=Endozoicomonas arenosclerae TaxID=1633495 RepID=UPI0007841EC1|nr:hypothetical protein [Endozoicomonas arenosclerae]